MKFKAGQLAWFLSPHRAASICIVIGEVPSTARGCSHAYDVWFLEDRQKRMLHKRYLSPIRPQEAQSEV